MKNPYEVLGVSKNATADEIKSAYRRMVKQYHPDANPNNKQVEEKMKEINVAYDVLSDPNKKANYDKFGSEDGAFGGGSGGAGGFGGFSNFDFGGAGGFGGFQDIFENLFESSGFSFGGGGRRARTMKGDDITIDMTISFVESCNGVTKTVSYNKMDKCKPCGGTGAKNGTGFTTCSYCNGNGRVKQRQSLGGFGIMENIVTCSVCGGTGKVVTDKCPECNGKGAIKKNVSYEVNIPAGIADGQALTITGEGNAVTGGTGISGDLHIRIRVIPHPILLREDFDLYMELPITFTEAILGTTVKIPVVGGTTTLEIPPNTQNGTIHRIRGKGVKKLRSIGSGDLIVKIFIEMPKSHDKKTAQLLRALDSATDYDDYKKVANYRKIIKKF
ncbi:MAG: molecular chaperone DnaJ [Christensenellaceae bacterium]|jgi:molecular chaperone DnaJ|nr:molecular chaperone DnaJ [Christensenellaceae bacterium]